LNFKLQFVLITVQLLMSGNGTRRDGVVDVSRFGLRVGDKAALAIRLAARPEGTTMGEIRSHTGQGQYNVFKRVEELGHTVIREGKGYRMHIRIVHRDERDGPSRVKIVQTTSQPINGLKQVDETQAVILTFSLERDLQRALRRNLSQLELGLTEADGGSEEDFRDITVRDKDENLVVIELKAVKAGRDAVAQLLTYMGDVAKKKGLASNKVRGILVAPEFQEMALAAASVVPSIKLRTYKVSFTFGDI
jgi:hypothetical protein